MTKTKDSHLLRKFTTLYLLFSILPFLLLFFLYTRYSLNDRLISITKEHLSILIMVTGVVCLTGFLAMRTTLRKFVVLAQHLRNTTLDRIDKSIIHDLAKEPGEVAELAKSFSDVLRRLEDNIQELENTKKKIYDIVTKVSAALASTENFDMLLHLVLEIAAHALGASRGVILSCDDERTFDIRATLGLPESPRGRLLTELQASLDYVRTERKPFILPSSQTSENGQLLAPPFLCVPAIVHGRLWGVVCLGATANGRNFNDDEITIVVHLGYQLAIALENAKLNNDFEQAYFETMSALALAVEARDPYSRGHSGRVAHYTTLIGGAMGLDAKAIETLRDASLMHDIGKIGIEDQVLKKDGALSVEEWQIMKQHPNIGENIVMPLKNFKHLVEPIRHHHEHLDGSGYPDGLLAAAIQTPTRIITVADIYDALTSDRPYRKALTDEEAHTVLDRMVAENKIDGNVVQSLYTLEARGAIESVSRKKPQSLGVLAKE